MHTHPIPPKKRRLRAKDAKTVNHNARFTAEQDRLIRRACRLIRSSRSKFQVVAELSSARMIIERAERQAADDPIMDEADAARAAMTGGVL